MFTHNLSDTIESASLIRRDNNGKGLYLILVSRGASQFQPFVVATYWEGSEEWQNGIYHTQMNDAYKTYIGKLAFYELSR